MDTGTKKRKAGPEHRDGGNRKKSKVSLFVSSDSSSFHLGSKISFSPCISDDSIVLIIDPGETKVEYKCRGSRNSAGRHGHMGDSLHEQGSAIGI